MRAYLPLCASAVLFLFASCEKSQEVKPEIKVSAESQAIFNSGISFEGKADGTGLTATVSFTATDEWHADVTDTKASTWLSVQPSGGGAGTVNMTVTAQPNTSDKERASRVTIKCGTDSKSFMVTQAGVQPAVIPVSSVSLNKNSLALTKGQSETLTAAVLPDNATDKTVSWSSSNIEIITVENGKVTAIKSGKATITATAGEKSATCEVTVTTPVASVSLDRTTVSLDEGQTTTLVATISPDDADEKAVSWTTSNAEIATVANGLVTAVKEGSAIITASVSDKSATCVVTVIKGVVEVTSVTLNKTTLSLTKGQSETLTATVNPADATDKTVTWSSSDATIASVTQNGLVTALKSGKVTIMAKAGEKSATCEVTITTPVESVTLDRTTASLEEGQTTTLVATINPNDADEKTVTWSTSNANVATVTNGVVTAFAEGTATIKASAGGKEATCVVTVQKKIVAVTSVTLNKTTLTLTKGQSETLTATVNPADATDKTVTWSCSDATIASVTQNGLVTALKSGKVTIMAKAGEKSATCEVTITTPVESVTLDRTTASLEEGQTTTLVATINPNDADEKTVTWSTSNANVATVTNGVVTAVAEGTATIKASAGGKEATCVVTVQKKIVAVTSVTLNKTTLTLTKGQSETLTATVNPADATDKTVTWSSSDATIASVTQNGLVTALKSGKVTIMAKAGEKSSTCEVTITTPVESVTLDRTTASLEEGQTTTLVATINPNDADEKTVTWSTSNANVATVTNGVVTAVAEGTATIKASAGGKDATCVVTVSPISVISLKLDKVSVTMKVGESATLKATVNPSNAPLTWKSSNTDVVTVNNGVITAHKSGEATITVQSGEKSAQCKVQVSDSTTGIGDWEEGDNSEGTI